MVELDDNEIGKSSSRLADKGQADIAAEHSGDLETSDVETSTHDSIIRQRRFSKKLIATALLITGVAVSTSPMWVRTIATTLDVGVPYLRYHNNPNQRYKVVDAVNSSMERWPEDSQRLLLALLDRVDEGRVVGTNFIAPLVASTYGFESDVDSVLAEWKILDKVEEYKKNLGEDYWQYISAVESEASLFHQLTNTSIPIEERINLLTEARALAAAFPHGELFRDESYEFSRVIFIFVHQQAYPSLSVDELSSMHHNLYPLYTSMSDFNSPSPYVEQYQQFMDLGISPDLEFFDISWQEFVDEVDDKFRLFLNVTNDARYRPKFIKLKELGITDPVLLYAMTYDSVPAKMYSFDESNKDLENILKILGSYQPGEGSFFAKVDTATDWLDEVFEDYLPESDQQSKNEVYDPYYEAKLREFAARYCPDDADKLFVVMREMVSGYHSPQNVETMPQSRQTLTVWSEDEVFDFFQRLFTALPNMQPEAILDLSNYLVGKKIEYGFSNTQTIEAEVLSILLVVEDVIADIYNLQVNNFAQQQMAIEILEQMVNQGVILNPTDLAGKINGLNIVKYKDPEQPYAFTFEGVHGVIDMRNFSLSREIFTRQSYLKENELAVVIAWSFMLRSSNPALDAGLINPALQANEQGELLPVSLPVGEGDLNNSENAKKRMFAVTQEGRVLEQPWSDFGRSGEEIIDNLKKAGVKTAFTPNYLWFAGQAESSISELNDFINSFLLVFENEAGETQVEVMILDPTTFTDQGIMETAFQQCPEGYKLRSVLWGDPGHQVYFNSPDDSPINGILVGVAERETHRLVFSLMTSERSN